MTAALMDRFEQPWDAIDAAAQPMIRYGSLTANTFDTLDLVSLHPHGVTQMHVAHRLGLTEAAAKKRLRRLVNRDLLTQTEQEASFPPAPRLYHLTTAGARELEHALRSIDDRSLIDHAWTGRTA